MTPSPLFLLLAAVLGGNVAGHHLPAHRAGSLLPVAVIMLAVAAVARRGRGPLVLAGVAVLAVALTGRALDGLRLGDADVHRAVSVTAELVGDSVPEAFRTRAIVRLDGRHVLAVAPRPWSSHLAVLEAGDRVVVRGRLGELSSSESARWRHRHVSGRLDVQEILGIQVPRDPLRGAANVVRRVVLAGAERLPSPERGLVAGFLVGDTRAIPANVVDAFRASGLSHLLAVSGANVALVLALVDPALRRLGVRGRVVLTLVVVAVFAAVTRFEPSVLRAASMAALSAAAALVGRPTSGLRILALAVIALLLLDPLLADSLGFRLSCAASAGILVFSGRLLRRLRGPLVIREAVAVTAAAQAGVLPVLIPTFGGIPLASVPANVAAIPLAAPLTLWGLTAGAGSAALGSVLPEVATALQVPTYLLARAVRFVATTAAGVPWVIGPRELAAALLVGTIALGLRRAAKT